MTRWRTTVSISDQELDAHLRSLADREDAETDAAVIRAAIRRSAELERCERERLELQQRTDSLRQQLAAANRRDQETQEIVEYVSQEREREAEHRSAPVWRRAKWWIFGRDGD